MLKRYEATEIQEPYEAPYCGVQEDSMGEFVLYSDVTQAYRNSVIEEVLRWVDDGTNWHDDADIFAAIRTLKTGGEDE